MRQGKVVEKANVETIFAEPQHAYTQALLKAARLETFDGSLPVDSLTSQLVEVGPDHWVRKEQADA